jgi:lipopolysaccharide export system protein LptC
MSIGSRLHKFAALAGIGIAAFGATYLALVGSDSPSGLLTRATNADRIDLYVEHARGSKFNEQGRLVQTFAATHMEHMLKSNQSNMTAPQFQIFTQGGEVWNGSAARATVLGDNEIQFRDHVLIVDTSGTQRLTTEQLDYFPEEEKIRSAVEVVFSRTTDTTKSIGLRADLNTNRIELLSRVEGVHAAP